MSNRNYTDYSKRAKKPSKDFESNHVKEPIEVIDIPMPTEPTEESFVKGEVVDCYSLNLRSGPSKDCDILCGLPRGTEVHINKTESSDDFYKVCTATGIEGFCVKAFIRIEE